MYYTHRITHIVHVRTCTSYVTSQSDTVTDLPAWTRPGHKALSLNILTDLESMAKRPRQRHTNVCTHLVQVYISLYMRNTDIQWTEETPDFRNYSVHTQTGCLGQQKIQRSRGQKVCGLYTSGLAILYII